MFTIDTENWPNYVTPFRVCLVGRVSPDFPYPTGFWVFVRSGEGYGLCPLHANKGSEPGRAGKEKSSFTLGLGRTHPAKDCSRPLAHAPHPPDPHPLSSFSPYPPLSPLPARRARAPPRPEPWPPGRAMVRTRLMRARPATESSAALEIPFGPTLDSKHTIRAAAGGARPHRQNERDAEPSTGLSAPHCTSP